jgi:hypothetical protein
MKAAQYTIISAGIAAFATTRKMHLIVNRVYTIQFKSSCKYLNKMQEKRKKKERDIPTKTSKKPIKCHFHRSLF